MPGLFDTRVMVAAALLLASSACGRASPPSPAGSAPSARPWQSDCASYRDRARPAASAALAAVRSAGTDVAALRAASAELSRLRDDLGKAPLDAAASTHHTTLSTSLGDLARLFDEVASIREGKGDRELMAVEMQSIARRTTALERAEKDLDALCR